MHSALLQWFPMVLVQQVVIRSAPAWVRALMRLTPGAIMMTVGNTIYVRDESMIDWSSARDQAVLAHELRHVEQYQEYGMIGFLLRYTLDWLRNGYRGVRFEIDAYALQRQVQTYFERHWELV